MHEDQLIRISKYLSKHLRHQPERLGLTLQDGGWVGVEELLAACSRNRMPLTRAELDEVVERNSKRRFSYDAGGTRIRANQGHSVEVDLQLAPMEPPETLYHGTGHNAVDSVLEAGLLKMRRHHVHLSVDVATARMVGSRHGRPVVLAVAAGEMHRGGHEFFVTENGVWLVEHVPPAYLERL